MTIRFMPAGGLRAVLCGVAGAWCVATHAASPLPSVSSDSPDAVATPAPAAASAPELVSSSAHKLYEQARHQLVQVRTLLSGQGSQSSVGSGFFVGEGGLIITNYHVVSQYALEPERHSLRYAMPDGSSGTLELLDIDVRHDLALLRMPARPGVSPLRIRPADQQLAKGERIYSMGNPQDVAFAVVEGTYNGLVERSFDALIYYSGAINPGMSGGPVLDEQGQVVGVNVSTLLFAQQMSFLVPARHAQALLERSRDAGVIKKAVWPQLRSQLMDYQEALISRFLAQPWRSLGHARYRLPIPQEDFMRCWGSGTPADAQGLQFQRTQCRMEQALFINEQMQTGYLSVAQESYDGRKLGALRFSRQYSASFRNEALGGADRDRSAPHCREEFVQQQGLPLRTVACLRAYRKLDGLYDLTVLVSTVDADTEGALGRLDATGISFANAGRLVRHYLQGFAWTKPQ